MTKINAGIGYGMLLRPVDLKAFREHLASVYTEREILEVAKEGVVYDPKNPLDCVEDVESLYSRFVSYEYDFLDFYGYGNKEEPNGYAVFAHRSQRLLSYSGNYEAPTLPYNEALEQLKVFQSKFCPGREIGWKQWVMDAGL